MNIYFLEYPCRKLSLTEENKAATLLTLHPLLNNNRVVYQVENKSVRNGNNTKFFFLFSMSSDDKEIDGAWVV